MRKLIDYKTFKELCDAAKIKGINLKECGLGDVETAAFVVTLDDGHFIAISIEAHAYSDVPDDGEYLEQNFLVRMSDAERTFKKGLNYYYAKN